MGYNTRFSLEWSEDTSYPTKDWQDLVKIVGEGKARDLKNAGLLDIKETKNTSDLISEYIESHDNMSYALDSDGNINSECKWYDHEMDMNVLSYAFPKVQFTLHGEGEESGDIWREYYLNGKVQVAKAVITFEESKLW